MRIFVDEVCRRYRQVGEKRGRRAGGCSNSRDADDAAGRAGESQGQELHRQRGVTEYRLAWAVAAIS